MPNHQFAVRDRRHASSSAVAHLPKPSRLWRVAGGTSAAVTALIFLGCMSISLGGGSTTCESHNAEDVLAQEGETTVPAHGQRVVYYPVPYASPPNLELKSCWSSWHECALVEQRPDLFRVHNPGAFSCTVSWTARGVRGAPPAVTVPPSGEPSAPALPPEPTPVPPTQPSS
jgi:hypothetical protein